MDLDPAAGPSTAAPSAAAALDRQQPLSAEASEVKRIVNRLRALSEGENLDSARAAEMQRQIPILYNVLQKFIDASDTLSGQAQIASAAHSGLGSIALPGSSRLGVRRPAGSRAPVDPLSIKPLYFKAASRLNPLEKRLRDAQTLQSPQRNRPPVPAQSGQESRIAQQPVTPPPEQTILAAGPGPSIPAAPSSSQLLRRVAQMRLSDAEPSVPLLPDASQVSDANRDGAAGQDRNQASPAPGSNPGDPDMDMDLFFNLP